MSKESQGVAAHVPPGHQPTASAVPASRSGVPNAGWIFEPHVMFRRNLDGEDFPYGYISEGPGKPIFALHEVIGERTILELAQAARLIAAAPVLLKALASIMNAHASNVLFHNRTLAEGAREAIRKATGDNL